MFAFKFDKAIQATAFLLRRESCREMSYIRLLKILYCADRESIRQRGKPITGGTVAAMKHGPVLSELLDLIKGFHLRSPEWSRFIQKDEFKIRLISDPGLTNLSRFDVETLERIAEEHRSHDDWDMVEYTHTFPEWQKNNPGDSMKWIPYSDILESIGRSTDILSIEEDAKTDRAFATLFGA